MERPVILLVEDNAMDVELTLDAFERANIESSVHVASDAVEALDYLEGRDRYADRSSHPMPNLILLDLKLPRMDGHALLRRIKCTRGCEHIPVVVLTSSRQDGDREESYDAGANSYLIKPISFEGFVRLVDHIANYWLRLNVGPPGGGAE